MGHARRPLSLALILLAASYLAVLGGGCGSSDETGSESSPGEGAATSRPPVGATAQSCTQAIAGTSQLRVTGIDCAAGRAIAVDWNGTTACAAVSDSSHSSCEVRDYRCLGAVTDRGLAVSCARPGRSISFLARRGQSDGGP